MVPVCGSCVAKGTSFFLFFSSFSLFPATTTAGGEAKNNLISKVQGGTLLFAFALVFFLSFLFQLLLLLIFFSVLLKLFVLCHFALICQTEHLFFFPFLCFFVLFMCSSLFFSCFCLSIKYS
ncbi:hypothetical protein, unlikely [Trypanosoma brucei gambiense DAL972]|uniref:Uncharacterized protein n=1 Tax=Trypanosoma brucei gambiense (strain MHOM/CI/86/DAL972) TaxID=679716 RepID=C9ZUV2_TRYB9|nr:hypothetical protein, unlikely [Trypanosoma brucei gambiense DAL972]CBH13190.1 hypothetical protein, unlikely [Trypanosoma brucei gambiense DAL972]|eukprot:XP_011775467.1 hypothetical protein, unlikely [Trypanosoma brucei gambiense DAL972]